MKEKRIDQLKTSKEQAEQKLEHIKVGLREIFYCLIKADRGGVLSDTIWVKDITTLWDYMANLLELYGDQNEIEKQIIDEVENDK